VAEAWLRSTLLSPLDARGRGDVRAAASTRAIAAGGVVFHAGDVADTLWFVASGSVEVSTPRGARRFGPGEHFGGESLVRGARRLGRASAGEPSSLVELPVGVLRRVLGRAGAGALLVREEIAAQRQNAALLFGATPLGQALDPRSLEALVSELRDEQRGRGERLFSAGEPARAASVVLHGLVELASETGSTYAVRGDLIALDAALAGGGHEVTATARSELVVAALSREQLRTLERSERAAFDAAGRAEEARRQKQRRLRELADAQATRHAFHELERLSNARSVLAIELEACVRCGHCTVACAELHGAPRFERRGERAVLALPGSDGVLAPRALLFPHACQHCLEPACLPECPTGALVRRADGTVDLAADRCTGCGACAKACPWDAIRMAPRSGDGAAAPGALVAVKCDLCHASDGPECVSACPTGAIVRVEPERDLLEVHGALGSPGSAARAARRVLPAPLGLAPLALLPPLVALGRFGRDAGRFRYETGILAAALVLVLLAHAAVKRRQPVRAWLRRRLGAALGARGLERLVAVHGVTGFAALAAVLAHTGGRFPAGPAGALALVFWLLAASGALGALVYRVVPARLARLEERGTLPEDGRAEREQLEQRLFAGLSESGSALKLLAARVVLPYVRSPLGPLALVVSGRTRRAEAANLGARVEALVGGRVSERLAGTRELVAVAVALRALGARRLLERVLGAWLPTHLVLAVLLAVLLAVHLVGVAR
jgi:Fe-S-cluster-containing dehydrogenase component